MKKSLILFPLILCGCDSVNSLLTRWDLREEMNLAKPVSIHLPATLETDPVMAPVDEDSADDPAIWVHPSDRSKSMIYGTDKKTGLIAYDLQGKKQQFLKVGFVNNVDVRYGFQLGNKKIDIAAASNRSNNSITIFSIDPDTGLLDVIHARDLISNVDDVYGFCLYKSPVSNKIYGFVNGKNGQIEQWELFANASDKIDAKIIRNFKVGSQPEGMVADDRNQVLYVGEENVAIWKFNAEPDGGSKASKVSQSDPLGNKDIVTDIEGLSIYYSSEKTGYLIASSQGNNSYAVFERQGSNQYMGSFSVVDSSDSDGIEETDGLDVINLALGKSFPNGFFVAQDGYNFGKEGQLTTQNFKVVSWEIIANAFENKLDISPEYEGWLNR